MAKDLTNSKIDRQNILNNNQDLNMVIVNNIMQLMKLKKLVI